MAKLSEKKKIELLEQAVLSGNIEEVKAVIAAHGSFELTARAFGLACIYTNEALVKLLAENGMTFRYEQEAGWKYKIHTTIDCYSYQAKYDLLIACSEHTFWHDHHFGNLPEITADMNDSRERMKILEFLLQDPEHYGMDLSRLLYYAILWRNRTVAEVLINCGVQLSPHQIYILEKTDRSWERNELNMAVRTMSEEDLIYVLQTFGMLLQKENRKFALTQGMVEYEGVGGKEINHTFLQPAVVKVILETANVEKLKKSDMMELLVREENITALELVIQAGWLKTTPQKEKLIQYATENQKTTALAWLMDYNAKTTDPAKEQAKEAAKVRRALNSTVSPAAELKKLWNYEKLEDGTIQITGYKGKETEIRIPAQIGKDRVTVIGPRTFDPFAPRIRNGYERNFIERVVVPEGVVKIDWMAFSSLRELTEVVLPESVKAIDESAFSYSDKVTVHAPAHSEAEFYAIKKGIPFVAE